MFEVRSRILREIRTVKSWGMETAVEFCRELEQALAPNYHVAMGGSVLHTGSSSNDLDVFVYPRTTTQNSIGAVHRMLLVFGMKLRVPNRVVRRKWEKQGSTDTKYVEVWVYNRRRIDVFYPWMEADVE